MDLENVLKEYRQARALKPEKENMEAAVEAGWGAFMQGEEVHILSYAGFLRMQFRVMKKRWWLFQLLVLAGIGFFYPTMDGAWQAHRTLGVAASLFVILLIPELWRNRSGQAMEVEAAAYYSLKQVYAARMLLFGIADVFMLTGFIAAASMTMKLAMTELLIQFLFPMTVTACICFGFLCSEKYFSGTAAAGMCLIWSVVWWMVLLNEQIYAAITMPVWVGLFVLALVFFGFSMVRSVKKCEAVWEVKADGIEIE